MAIVWKSLVIKLIVVHLLWYGVGMDSGVVLLSITNESYTVMEKIYKTMYLERGKILLVLLVL